MARSAACYLMSQLLPKRNANGCSSSDEYEKRIVAYFSRTIPDPPQKKQNGTGLSYDLKQWSQLSNIGTFVVY